MSQARNRRITSAVVVGTLVAGILTLVGWQPAQADHDDYTLRVSKEVTQLPAGTSVPLTATLETPATSLVTIRFEYENGPGDPDGVTPLTPDATCTVAAAATSCSVSVAATAPGQTVVRAWVDHVNTPNVAESDGGEARQSGPTDCLGETPGTDLTNCQAGGTDAGGKSEPDNTDVVLIDWLTSARVLNCDEAPRGPIGGNAKVNCNLRDQGGVGVAGIPIDGENLNAPNNPDDNSTADYNNMCITDINGNCQGSLDGSAGESGFGNVCFWGDTDTTMDTNNVTSPSYVPAGTVQEDGGDCDVETAGTDDNDLTDVGVVTWEPRALSSLDATPEATTGTALNTAHSITVTTFDQFGEPWLTNTNVKAELFAGSPNDTDGDLPASPDLGACDTNTGGGDTKQSECVISYTGTKAGTDVMCVWFGATPAMTGSGTSGFCDGEIRGTDSSGRVDVVSKEWGITVAPPPPPPPASETQGYTLVGADGGVYNFGTSTFQGSTGGMRLNQPVIGIASKKGSTGYWLVARDGGIFSFGDAEFFGSMGDQALNAPVLGMEATPSGKGYWLFAADGGIFSFGDASFHGSTGSTKLNAPVVGMAINQKGDGYWLVAQDGGIFSFDAPFHGSTGSMKLNQPVFDMGPTADDKGYWLVARDGGIFSFGDAETRFYGSAVGATASPIIGLAVTPTSLGYWIADNRGGVFPFGDARFFGDRRNDVNNAAMVGFAGVPKK